MEGGAALNGHQIHLSPDTNGFLFLGVVKNKFYERHRHTVNKLKTYISDAFTEIYGDGNLRRTACQSDFDRHKECCKVEGRHFSDLRD